MATISDIRNHRRGSPRVDVYLDGDYWRGFPRPVLGELDVRVGDEVEPWTLSSDAECHEVSYSRARILRLLAYRERCSAELEQRLVDDGVAESVARAAVADFVETGLIDDVRFAEVLTRTLLRQGQAPAKIRRDMERRGLDAHVAAAALQAALGEHGEVEHLQLAARRMHRPGDTVDRLAARLARRGFSTGDSLRAARVLVDDDGTSAESQED